MKPQSFTSSTSLSRRGSSTAATLLAVASAIALLGQDAHAQQTNANVVKPNTYDVDLGGGREKTKGTNQPPPGSKTTPEHKPTPAELLSRIHQQADAIAFLPEQSGPAHAGIRGCARYFYVLTNVEQQIKGEGRCSLQEQAGIAFDTFLRSAKSGEFGEVSPREQARSLLEITEKQPSRSLNGSNAAPARLPDATIAAVGYLALRFTFYDRPPDLAAVYKPGVLQHCANPAAFWHPWAQLFKAGLSATTFEKTLMAIPLAPVDSPLPPEPPKPFWHDPQTIPTMVKSISEWQRPGLIIIYCHDTNDAEYEIQTFRTKEFCDYMSTRPGFAVKAVPVQGPSGNSRMAPATLHGQYGVKTFPTIIVLGSDGTELARPSTSVPGPAPLLQALEQLGKQNATLTAQRAAKARQDYIDEVRKSRPPRRSGGAPFR